jgi:O-antigen/teichoic acid export membrane protein
MRLNNIAWSLSGLIIPLIMAFLFIPALLNNIGTERFGLLSLAWGLLNYASIFDLGIGRAATQLISKKIGEKNHGDILKIASTSIKFSIFSGIIGFIILASLALAGISNFIKQSSNLENELTISVFILSLIIPIQAVSATYRGINEALEQFKGISIIRIILGIINFAGPYTISFYTNNLGALVATLLFSRLMALYFYQITAKNAIKNITTKTLKKNNQDKEIRSHLLSYGGWITVSSIISPLLVQADRFIIAGVLSASAVTIYTIPYELVVQSLVLVGAFSSVFFPSITKLMHENSEKWEEKFSQWLIIITILMIITTTLLGLFLPFILSVWIGKNMHEESLMIGKILLIGVLANSIGSMYYAVIQAKGRSDITAKIHLIEIIPFIITLYYSTKEYGLYGTAWVWSTRMITDAILLIISKKIICS